MARASRGRHTPQAGVTHATFESGGYRGLSHGCQCFPHEVGDVADKPHVQSADGRSNDRHEFTDRGLGKPKSSESTGPQGEAGSWSRSWGASYARYEATVDGIDDEQSFERPAGAVVELVALVHHRLGEDADKVADLARRS
jgi:hypothetical protein